MTTRIIKSRSFFVSIEQRTFKYTEVIEEIMHQTPYVVNLTTEDGPTNVEEQIIDLTNESGPMVMKQTAIACVHKCNRRSIVHQLKCNCRLIIHHLRCDRHTVVHFIKCIRQSIDRQLHSTPKAIKRRRSDSNEPRIASGRMRNSAYNSTKTTPTNFALSHQLGRFLYAQNYYSRLQPHPAGIAAMSAIKKKDFYQ